MVGKTVTGDLIAKAKRLATVADGLRDAEEGLEVAIGQLTFMEEQALKGRGRIPVSTEYKEVEDELSANIEFLRSRLDGWRSSLILDIAQLDDRGISELEKPLVVDQAEKILRGNS